MLGTLQAYKGEPFLHGVVKAFIRRYLSNENNQDYRSYRNDLYIVLSQIGGVTGEYGIVNAYKGKKENIKNWESESDPAVKRFLAQYKEYLDKNIDFQKKRADIDIELMKQSLV